MNLEGKTLEPQKGDDPSLLLFSFFSGVRMGSDWTRALLESSQREEQWPSPVKDAAKLPSLPNWEGSDITNKIWSSDQRDLESPKSDTIHGMIPGTRKTTEEVENMSEYVSKDAFDAHIRRIDDRMSSMEDRLSGKIDRLVDSVDGLKTSVEDQRKEIHIDNMATRLTNYTVIITAIVGFIAIIVTITR